MLDIQQGGCPETNQASLDSNHQLYQEHQGSFREIEEYILDFSVILKTFLEQ